MNEAACNYDASYTIEDNASCTFAAAFYGCDGACLGDNDGDGVCNELELPGCMDGLALNFDSPPIKTDLAFTPPLATTNWHAITPLTKGTASKSRIRRSRRNGW